MRVTTALVSVVIAGAALGMSGGPAVGSPAQVSGAVNADATINSDAIIVERWAGANRYASSAAFSARSFAPGVAVAYVALGLEFADALSGAPIAGKTAGPVLLTSPTALPGPIAAELVRLKPQKIVVLGGTGAVSAAVARRWTRTRSERWSGGPGANRYASSAASRPGPFAPGVAVAYVATGWSSLTRCPGRRSRARRRARCC